MSAIPPDAQVTPYSHTVESIFNQMGADPLSYFSYTHVNLRQDLKGSYFSIKRKMLHTVTYPWSGRQRTSVGSSTHGYFMDKSGNTFTSPTYKQWHDGMVDVNFYDWKTEIKPKIKEFFMSQDRDADIIENVKHMSMKYFPVRSGKLIDTIYNSMRIMRASYYSQFMSSFGFDYPPDRPHIIGGRVTHSPPETGYAEYYRLRHNIPNVHLLYRTKGGNAKYLLDDLTAVSDPASAVQSEANQALIEDYKNIFDTFELELRLFKGDKGTVIG